jgi:hypothetical protein
MSESFDPVVAGYIGFWVAVSGVVVYFRFRAVRRRLSYAGTQELAERLGLTFDPQCVHGGVGAYGQLPDGRGVRMYEEHRRGGVKALFPWHRETCAGSIVEVGVQAEAWEQLNADQRDEAGALMSPYFYRALDRYRDTLAGMGFSAVTLMEGAVRLKAGKRLPSPDAMAGLLEALGRIAAETESMCIERVLTGRRPDDEPQVASEDPSEHVQHEAPATPADESEPVPSYAKAPWRCDQCDSLNPPEMKRCQMCSTERAAEGASAS